MMKQYAWFDINVKPTYTPDDMFYLFLYLAILYQ